MASRVRRKSVKRKAKRHAYRKKPKRTGYGCRICGEPFYGLPFRCSRCGGLFCSRHRLPESHNCTGLKKTRKLVLGPASGEARKTGGEEQHSEPLGKDIENRGYGEYRMTPEERERIKREFDEIRSKKRPKRDILFGAAVVAAIIIGVSISSGFDFTSPLLGLNCTDGTYYNHCSANRPYFCSKGSLIEKASVCGCLYDYRPDGEACEKIKRCEDGTVYGKCSASRPFYCINGFLVRKASVCGCAAGFEADGEKCVSVYLKGPKEMMFQYVLRGHYDVIIADVYKGLKDYLAGIDRHYYCDPVCPSDRELELRYIDEEQQKENLIDIAEIIRSLASEKDDQARIAISLVQNIPYDWAGYGLDDLNNRYPYEVLYDNRGVCAEKSRLLAFFLRELGYGVALFNFEGEMHMAVGIKCPYQYDYEDSGYCFIESTVPSIITDSTGDYIEVGKLTSAPDIIRISDGVSFDSVDEEYEDLTLWIYLNVMAESSGGLLSPSNYRKWERLVEKYGIQVSD